MPSDSKAFQHPRRPGFSVGRQLTARSAFSIQKDVIFAIFLRELSARFSGYVFGTIWVVLEPLLMMLIFIMLFGLRGRGEFGYAEPPIFILAAFLPFKLLWQMVMRDNLRAIGAGRSLVAFRQVSIFDMYLARTLVNAAIAVGVGTLLVLAFYWVGLNAVPVHLLEVFGICLLLMLLAGAFGILASLLAETAKEIEKLITLITMPLMFLSAVFYPMTVVPMPYRDWLAWNPLVHALELIREYWFGGYVSPVASLPYLAGWTLCMLAVAIAAYRLRWRRILAL